MGWGIIGQDRAVAALERALAEGRLAHAYLFVGPERVGKHTLALSLAQALNCTGDAPPCGECNACRRIAGGLHADVQTVTVGEPEPEDESGPAPRGIHVSQVREVERATALKPYEGRCRVVIVDPADEMNPAAQNAFLKTLEEPPPQVVFALLTADEQRLLPTVRSRCRRLALPLPSLGEIEGALAERGLDPERARLLARLSRGRIGWALEAADDDSLLERRATSIEQARSLATMRVAERMALAERLGLAYRRDPAPVLSALEAWRDWWRDVLLVQAGAEDGVASLDRLDELREDADGRDRESIARFVRAAGEAGRYLSWNAQARLVLEALLLEAPSRASAGVR